MYLIFTFDSYSSCGGINDLLTQVDTLEEFSKQLTITINNTFVYYCGLGGSTTIQFRDKKLQEYVQIYSINKRKVIFKCKDLDYFYYKNPKHWLFANSNVIEKCNLNIDSYINKQKQIEDIKSGKLIVVNNKILNNK